ncbi:MAG: hypothetical protein JWQ87_2196 [Candidatus Sulfotelmatobacter sp.]|nr:hypothetical protein [Candidatus Sulfotelmatobacter sp.]
MQPITAGMKIAPAFLRRTAGHLLHPLLIWMPGDPSDVDSPGFEVEKEQDVIGHQPPPTEYLHRKRPVNTV